MITGDMFTFSIIYIIVLFGFSQAYFFLYKGHENVDETPYGTYWSTWMGLLQTTLGDYDVSMVLFIELTFQLNWIIYWFRDFPFYASVRATERCFVPESGKDGFHHIYDFRSHFAAEHVDRYDG